MRQVLLHRAQAYRQWLFPNRVPAGIFPPFALMQFVFSPILGVLSCLGLMATLPGDTWLRLLVWLLIGLVIYFTYGRKHSVLQREREQQAQRKPA